MDELVEESDKQEDLQTSPYNTPVDTAHYTLTPHTSTLSLFFFNILIFLHPLLMLTCLHFQVLLISLLIPHHQLCQPYLKLSLKSLPKIQQNFPIPKYIRESVQYVSENAVQ